MERVKSLLPGPLARPTKSGTGNGRRKGPVGPRTQPGLDPEPTSRCRPYQVPAGPAQTTGSVQGTGVVDSQF
jgi:hypothetical protein